MKNKKSMIKSIISIGIIFLLLTGIVIPITIANDSSKTKAFEKGIPWQAFTPLKRATFVGFDKESYVDDYSYLASIPANVFSDGEIIYTNPLLFFQPEDTYPDEDQYRFLNDYSGTHYLMEDWMEYCNGNLDKISLINIDENDLEETWNARDTTVIKDNDPFKVASEIALKDWSYSDDAIVAVIEEDFEKPEDTKTTGKITGKISGKVGKDELTVKRPYGPSPEYAHFTVDNQYKYVRVDLYYSSIVYISSIMKLLPGFPKGWVTIPHLDPDLQLYCKYDGDWLLTDASADMTITNGPHEVCFSYVYNPGDWKVGVTNMPTEGGDIENFISSGPLGKVQYYGNKFDALKSAFGKEVTEYYCDITLYPGEEKIIPDTPTFGCGDAKFKLTWDNPNIDLGLTIIGPNGEEIESAIDGEDDEKFQEIIFDRIGECPEGKNYKVIVYALDDINSPVNFEVDYSWEQKNSKKEGDCLASASEGAILGSILNAPLLYTSASKAPQCTIDALYKLGVENIHIVDLGSYLSKECKDKLSDVGKITNHFKEYNLVYDAITSRTSSTDLIFSTVDPWSYWLYNESAKGVKPYGEFEKSFYFGPAAYAAAFHGSPLLLVDNHPELSSSVMYHREYWRKNANGYNDVPSAPLFLTGTNVYNFLRKNGLDKEGPESILTVAGQYDIGPTWTRMFAGVGNPGNIIGTPIDTSNWITRSIFYPALIFENPALKGTVSLENGSKSVRIQPKITKPFQALRQRLFQKPLGSNLKLLRESKEEEYTYPILCTYGTYSYRFNERGEKFWDTYYHTRNGFIPGVSISFEEIDEGVRKKFENLDGSFLPDLSESEITPFYAKKAGYDCAFSTNFDITMENLNKGAISWYFIYHGNSANGGELSWYSPNSISELIEGGLGLPSPIAKIIQLIVGLPLGVYPTVEINPWRGYEWLWGSTEEPDSASLNTEIGLFLGILGLADPDGPLNGGILKTGIDILPSSIALFNKNRESYHDGLVGPFGLTGLFGKYHFDHTAAEIDDKLENLHSMSLHSTACLLGGKYFQIAFMRHGSISQELDPWGTSYWGAPAHQMTPRNFALGKTIGESYAEGRCEIGVKFVFEEDEKRLWWWDNAENNVLYADPDLRIWVPSDEWDLEARNHWESSDIKSQSYSEEFNVNGHMPFGVTNYPHEKEPEIEIPMLYVIIVIVLLLVIVIGYIVYSKKRNK